jgi:Domain of Unknown Function (DUF1080)
MLSRSSIPWRLKAGACLASATLSVALVAVFAPPTIAAQQKPAAPSRFVQPEPMDFEGYQADFDYNNRYTGQFYEQDSDRGIIAWRAQMVATESGKKPRLIASLGNPDDLKAFIKPGEWNQVEIIADGHTLIHIVNGHVMATLVDTDPKYYQAKGLIAFEIEGPGNLKISHRNAWLKKLP